MTSTVVLELLQKYKLNSEKMMVEILYLNTTGVIGGTTADLITGDRVSVKELLYGMMLPSGNDAAQSLGVYFGNFA
jgi:D-alanyl-D-alanine carboxypeptidase